MAKEKTAAEKQAFADKMKAARLAKLNVKSEDTYNLNKTPGTKKKTAAIKETPEETKIKRLAVIEAAREEAGGNEPLERDC